jgi:hypothetical protein
MADEFDLEKPDDVLQAELDPNNAGNPVAVRAKQKKVVLAETERRAVIGALLETKEGRRFLKWLVADVGQLYSSLVKVAGSGTDLRVYEGMRHAAQILDLECLRSDPTRYMIMRKEIEGLE